MKVEFASSSEISIDDMQDGQIAIIVNWPDSRHIGSVVQRYSNSLITIGKNSGQAWTTIFNTPNHSEHIVKLLRSGDKIVIE